MNPQEVSVIFKDNTGIVFHNATVTMTSPFVHVWCRNTDNEYLYHQDTVLMIEIKHADASVTSQEGS